MIKITMEVDEVSVYFTGMAEYDNGNKFWYKEGKYHRIDGPAIQYSNGDNKWYKEGQLHREDGPAIEFNGSKFWYKKGQQHRIDGPAVEYANGNKEWYIDGKPYTEAEFNKKINNCEGKVVEIDGKKYKLTLTN